MAFHKLSFSRFSMATKSDKQVTGLSFGPAHVDDDDDLVETKGGGQGRAAAAIALKSTPPTTPPLKLGQVKILKRATTEPTTEQPTTTDMHGGFDVPVNAELPLADNEAEEQVDMQMEGPAADEWVEPAGEPDGDDPAAAQAMGFRYDGRHRSRSRRGRRHNRNYRNYRGRHEEQLPPVGPRIRHVVKKKDKTDNRTCVVTLDMSSSSSSSSRWCHDDQVSASSSTAASSAPSRRGTGAGTAAAAPALSLQMLARGLEGAGPLSQESLATAMTMAMTALFASGARAGAGAGAGAGGNNQPAARSGRTGRRAAQRRRQRARKWACRAQSE
jgi:hypothetical protein